MAKVIVLGSSAEFPLPRTKSNKFEDYLDIENYERRFELHDDPLCNSAKKTGPGRASKDRRTRACLAIVLKEGTILFDAGPDIRYQLKKYNVKPDVVFISHEHLDANYGLRYLKGVNIFSEKIANIQHGQSIEMFGASILPFRVQHSTIAPCTGYQIRLGKKYLVYVTDMASLEGVRQYFQGADVLFADGSILNRDLSGHLSITNQLKFYKKWRLKRVIFTHIGHATLPYGDLLKHLKSQFKNAEIAYDGMRIKI